MLHVAEANMHHTGDLHRRLPPPMQLLTEYLQSKYAIGLSTVKPRFSWKPPMLNSTSLRGAQQTSYRIQIKLVHSNKPDKLMWDTGVVRSNQTVNVPYKGKSLFSDTSYAWTVQWSCCDNDHLSAPASASFSIGLLTEKAWSKAKWVGNSSTNLARIELPLLKELPSSARLFISAPGCVVLSMNGKPLGIENGVCPLATLPRYLYAEAHDLQPYLRKGRNTLGLILGNGLYASFYETLHRRKHPIMPKFRAKIVIQMGSKTMVVVSGDKGWIGTKGHILHEDPFSGTVIDWRLLPHNWDQPQDNAEGGEGGQGTATATAKWVSLPIVQGPKVLPRGMHMPFSVSRRRVTPISVHPVTEGGGAAFVYDLGENIVGTCEVHAKGPPGASVTLRGGEFLLKNGSLSLNYAKRDKGVLAHFQRDHHLLRGEGKVEILRPIFVWYGMQFVSVHIGSGVTFNGDLNELTCHQFLPDIPETSSIEFGDDELSKTSGELLGKIQQMVLLTQKGNLADYAPTDCPTREKHFWLGDALVSAKEAMLNLHMAPLLTNYIEMIASAQWHGDVPPFVPGHVTPPVTDISWTSAFPLLTYGMYQHYGDVDIVLKHYSAMSKYMVNLERAAKHFHRDVPNFYQYGDWCSNQSRKKATPHTGPPLAAFHYILACDAMAVMSRAIFQSKKADSWEDKANRARTFWHGGYNEEHGLYGYESENGFAVQTMTAAPLAMGNVIPLELHKSVLRNLAASVHNSGFHPTFGSIGAKHVLSQLSAHGLHGTAMRIATQREFPGYGHWLESGELLRRGWNHS
jgi:alpha-L-rhamnosidase